MNGIRNPQIRLTDFDRLGKKKAGRILDGITHDAHPWDGL